MAKKATLVCRPCGTRVLVSDLGAAVVECYECGMELVPSAKAPTKKALPTRKKAAPKKARPAKAAAKKRAPAVKKAAARRK